MQEEWKVIKQFPMYSVSTQGNVRKDSSGRVLRTKINQYGVVSVGLMRHGNQYQRSVPLLVASAFVSHPFGPFDTPINLDGNRENNVVDNLVWRPRWFAVQYNRQFRKPYENPIFEPIQNLSTGEVFPDSMACCTHYGLLEKDLVLSILNRTYVWPLYQQFAVVPKE